MTVMADRHDEILDRILHATNETKVEVGKVATRLEAGEKQISSLTKSQTQTGMMVARIDERTEEHARRMDRTDRRAGAVGAVSGGGLGAILAYVVQLFKGDS